MHALSGTGKPENFLNHGSERDVGENVDENHGAVRVVRPDNIAMSDAPHEGDGLEGELSNDHTLYING